ncbi:hypothetical protein ACFQV4_29440 [Streptomyces thermocarboxydus]
MIDAYGRTSNPDVVAAGDCTDLDAGDGRLVRIESVANAIAQARAAAASRRLAHAARGRAVVLVGPGRRQAPDRGPERRP